MTTPRIPKSVIQNAVPEIDSIDFIDRGGQGDAWRIRRGGGDEVLKLIIGADPARVAREIDTMKAVSDPHVMGFSDAGSLSAPGGQALPYIIGEYVSGRSIAKRMEADEWPTELEALAATVGALRGIAAIHAAEVVHRDIKPGNIALRNDDWTDPVILDLGLVRDMLGTSITVYPNLLGTIPYMAPEQLRKEPAVRRSDVFAAGVTLFILLTQHHPFFDATETHLAIEVLEERVRDDDRPRWQDFAQIADDVREVLEPMLRPDAFARPRAPMAADALQSILDDR